MVRYTLLWCPTSQPPSAGGVSFWSSCLQWEGPSVKLRYLLMLITAMSLCLAFGRAAPQLGVCKWKKMREMESRWRQRQKEAFASSCSTLWPGCLRPLQNKAEIASSALNGCLVSLLWSTCCGPWMFYNLVYSYFPHVVLPCGSTPIPQTLKHAHFWGSDSQMLITACPHLSSSCFFFW